MAGAVIVTTPQDVALIDARKGLNMFRKVNVPVIGIVENMSSFVCPHCGETTDIFKKGGGRKTAALRGTASRGSLPAAPTTAAGRGGARDAAARRGPPVPGAPPLAPGLARGGAGGVPIVVSEPRGGHADA